MIAVPFARTKIIVMQMLYRFVYL